MKLLFAENLSPALARALAELFPGSVHDHDEDLGAADDQIIWEYAKANGFTIVTKDSDFDESSVLYGSPPKVIWLRVGNCPTEPMSSFCGQQAKPSVPLLKTMRKPASS